MIVLPLIPLIVLSSVIIFIVFREQIKQENYLEKLYEEYGVIMTVNVLSSKHTLLSDNRSNSFYFNVSFIDKHKKEHKYTVSTSNKCAGKYLEQSKLEVFCLLPLFEDHKNIYEFISCISDTSKELRKNLNLYSIPLMIIKEDREFRKNGTVRRYKIICLLLYIVIINVLLYLILCM